MLGMDADERRDVRGKRIYVEGGREVAVLALAGEELITDFEPPRALDEYAGVMHFYAACPGRPGWLRFRRPATRDPRPSLEANLGSMLGRAAYERHPPARFRGLATTSRYVCLELSRVPRWGGDAYAPEFPAEAALYQRVLAGPDTASLLELGDESGDKDGGWVLALGTSHPLFHAATSGGGLFARVVSHGGTDEVRQNDELEALLARAPADGWQDIGEVDVREPIRAFDAATFGGAIGEGDSLTLALSPGAYSIAHRAWQADAATELLLVRLRRA
jgi:hypothetical protein